MPREKPRAAPRAPRRKVDPAAVAALERRVAAEERGEPANVQTSERPNATPDAPPTGPGIVERKGRITREGRTEARVLRRLTVYLPPELTRKLDVRAIEEGRDRSELIANAVAAYLERAGGAMPEPGADRERYHLGWSHVRRLRPLASVAGPEATAAIDRLDAFEGTASDVQLAARLYREAGDVELAASVDGMLGP